MTRHRLSGRRGGSLNVAASLVAPPPGAPLVTHAKTVTLQACLVRTRLPPRPHIAPPNLTPVPPPPPVAAFGTQIETQAGFRRPVLPIRPHLASPLVTGITPAAPTQEPPNRRVLVGRRWGGVVYSGNLVAPAATPGPPLTFHARVFSQAVQRALTRRTGPPKPHLAPPTLAAGAAPGPPLVTRAHVVNYQAVFVRPVLPLRAHLAPSVLGLLLPPLPGFVWVGLREDAKGRDRILRPHYASPVLSVTAQPPPMVTEAIRVVPPRSRQNPAPRAHLAPPNLTQPPPIPLPPAVVVSQCLRRPYVGRTIPRPHTAKGIVAPPAAPGSPLRTRPLIWDQAVQTAVTYRRLRPFSPLTAPNLTAVRGTGSDSAALLTIA